MLWLGALFVTASAGCVAALAVRAKRIAALEAVGVWVTGTVVTQDLASEQGMYIVEFTDETGRAHRTYSLSSSAFWPGVGQPVRVLYDRRDPTRARIHVVDKTGRIGLAVLAVLFGALGALLLWRAQSLR